jgi:IS5 family transposase
MSPKRVKIPPIDRIERDFLAAIERLENKVPLRNSLKRFVSAGKLKINKSTVAREAGHSRTKIYDYPRVIEKISGSREPTRTARTAKDVITRLREDNAVLKQERNAALSALAGLTIRLHQERKEHERKVREIQRSASI